MPFGMGARKNIHTVSIQLQRMNKNINKRKQYSPRISIQFINILGYFYMIPDIELYSVSGFDEIENVGGWVEAEATAVAEYVIIIDKEWWWWRRWWFGISNILSNRQYSCSHLSEAETMEATTYSRNVSWILCACFIFEFRWTNKWITQKLCMICFCQL